MNDYTAALVKDLQAVLADLGKDGGLLSPSVYDTAQVLRFYPSCKGPDPALDWLTTQQHTDGGWGNAEAPYARVVPTVAALLALHTYRRDAQTNAAINDGLTFLHQQAAHWQEFPIDALPIATEIILPCLLEEANAVGLEIAREPYLQLYQLRQGKLQQLAKRTLLAGAPPTYSWEALSKTVSPPLLDQSGGIGHSPSATAAWLQQAQPQATGTDQWASARRYLHQAAAATGTDIPGVVPNVWPITGFELSYGLYALLITQLFHHPLLQEVINPQVDRLHTIMIHGHGVSFGEYFTPDVDETAVGFAALQAGGRPVDTAVIRQFKQNGHFCTFPHELNPSVFSNAHALYALTCVAERSRKTEAFLLERQCQDGRWLADKWHSSWLYTTLEALLALDGLGYSNEVMKAVDVLLHTQKPDGGWGSGAQSTALETTYAVIAFLHILHQGQYDAEALRPALKRGCQWLQQPNQTPAQRAEVLWLGKELYSPYRVDQIYHLSALLWADLRTEEVQQ